eukprot:131854-Pyramimonas_sp.AAC.1
MASADMANYREASGTNAGTRTNNNTSTINANTSTNNSMNTTSTIDCTNNPSRTHRSNTQIFRPIVERTRD